jgi:hypothetical protein
MTLQELTGDRDKESQAQIIKIYKVSSVVDVHENGV